MRYLILTTMLALLTASAVLFGKTEKPVIEHRCSVVTSFEPGQNLSFATEYAAKLEATGDTLFATLREVQLSTHQLYWLEITRFQGKMPVITSAERLNGKWQCQDRR